MWKRTAGSSSNLSHFRTSHHLNHSTLVETRHRAGRMLVGVWESTFGSFDNSYAGGEKMNGGKHRARGNKEAPHFPPTPIEVGGAVSFSQQCRQKGKGKGKSKGGERGRVAVRAAQG
ncbi:hypothetical protein NDA10_002243 [Ustilago hordei]|nr:hypothetical protein NDA10_002243 [Ustilago hordei]UTT88023.1 hypothetical protein NDA17_002230 [Ustilago hordei]